jgi:two-component system NtrC family sensor kinase
VEDHLVDRLHLPAQRVAVLLAAVAVLAIPALHPLLRPTVGVPSHLLWFVHVLPVALLAYIHGRPGAAAGAVISTLWVATGESLFGAGYGHPADHATVLALSTAVGFTNLLAAGFALWVRAEESRHRDATYQLRAGLDASADAVLMLDAERHVRYANASARALLCTRPGELAGTVFESLLIGAESGGGSPVLRAAEGKPAEVVARAAGGHPLAAELSVAPVRDDAGHPAAYLVTVRDQSERLRREQATRRTQALTELGTVIASIAHDLTNPLAAVTSFADVVSETPGLPGDAREGIDIMTREARRAAGIARQLLGLVRNGGRPREVMNLHELVEQALKARGRSFAAHGIEVLASNGVPASTVMGVRGEIEQVLSNLLANAEQAMYEAHGRGRLTVALHNGDAMVDVAVADDGPGISRENLARLFEPFFTTKPVGSGTGLGLSIARRIARDHGGDLLVESAPGKGATFTLRLPLATEPLAAEAPNPAAEPKRQSSAPSARILVLDDEPSIRRAVEKLLGRKGHVVATAADGPSATQALEKTDFDLVFCDVHLGETDGVELYRAVIARRPEYRGRFVFMTGDVMSAELREFCAKTGCAHLAKPFETEELLEAVAHARTA